MHKGNQGKEDQIDFYFLNIVCTKSEAGNIITAKKKNVNYNALKDSHDTW